MGLDDGLAVRDRLLGAVHRPKPRQEPEEAQSRLLKLHVVITAALEAHGPSAMKSYSRRASDTVMTPVADMEFNAGLCVNAKDSHQITRFRSYSLLGQYARLQWPLYQEHALILPLVRGETVRTALGRKEMAL
jgi:hypothetical protein